MVLGMGLVFLFLFILIMAVKAGARVIQFMGWDADLREEPKPAATEDSVALVAVIAAATEE